MLISRITKATYLGAGLISSLLLSSCSAAPQYPGQLVKPSVPVKPVAESRMVPIDVHYLQLPAVGYPTGIGASQNPYQYAGKKYSDMGYTPISYTRIPLNMYAEVQWLSPNEAFVHQSGESYKIPAMMKLKYAAFIDATGQRFAPCKRGTTYYSGSTRTEILSNAFGRSSSETVPVFTKHCETRMVPYSQSDEYKAALARYKQDVSTYPARLKHYQERMSHGYSEQKAKWDKYAKSNPSLADEVVNKPNKKFMHFTNKELYWTPEAQADALRGGNGGR